MNDELAWMCMDAGMKRWLSARDCPPPRIGALGAIHKYNMVVGVECIVCHKEECPKNHIQHYEIVVENEDGSTNTTKGAKLHLEHHKNERKHGVAIIPLPPPMVEVVTLLEKASMHLAPECPTLFFNQKGQPYSGPHISIAAKDVLSLGSIKCNATDMRHEFSTNWRDFMDSASGQVVDMLARDVEGAAAYMMGNSSAAWDATYDDNMRSRAKERVLLLYPKFQEYVLAEASKRKQVRPRNPHS